MRKTLKHSVLRALTGSANIIPPALEKWIETEIFHAIDPPSLAFIMHAESQPHGVPSLMRKTFVPSILQLNRYIIH